MATTKIQRALISVSDKTGLVAFAKGLVELGVEIISTGGTAKVLAEAGIKTKSVEAYTGFPEILDGRVKTLNPKIYAGLLAVRTKPEHVKALKGHDIEPIDLVVVNLYPFSETVAKGASDEAIIENIDIGGPTLIRAAAKNHQFAAAVVNPERYQSVLNELKKPDGGLSAETRKDLAAEAFNTTARYDSMISGWFNPAYPGMPAAFNRPFTRELVTSYGENPHQQGAFFAEAGNANHLLSDVNKLHGKDLSFNNLLDLDSARKLSEEFGQPAAVIVKHNIPCGVAVADDLNTAFDKALAGDPLSAFGGVAVFNRPVDKALAKKLNAMFIEVVFTPGFAKDALAVLKQKKNIRLLEWTKPKPAGYEPDIKRVRGGLLAQDPDILKESRKNMKIVTKAKPSAQHWADLLFAWIVCKHVRSNAIVFAKSGATLGIGAGQVSRVDSVDIAVAKAKRAKLSLKGSVVASDAFFPFADGPKGAIDAGAAAIIQPGGSLKDQEVIDAVDAAKIAMVFTGKRHFRH